MVVGMRTLRLALEWVVKPVVSLIVGRAVMGALHQQGIAPDVWLEAALVDTPAAVSSEFAVWTLAALLGVIVWAVLQFVLRRFTQALGPTGKLKPESLAPAPRGDSVVKPVVEFVEADIDRMHVFGASNEHIARAFVQSSGTPISKVIVKLVRVVRCSSPFQPLLRSFPRRLLSEDGTQTVTLYADPSVGFHLFERRPPVQEGGAYTVIVAPGSAGPEIELEPGTYHLTLHGSGAGTSAVTKQVYEVGVTHNGASLGMVDGSGDEPEAYRLPHVPNLTIKELFLMVDPLALEGDRRFAIGRVLRDKLAIHGQLTCWGRPIKNWIDRDLKVLNPPDEIPHTYWQKADLSYTFLDGDFQDIAPHTVPEMYSALPEYADLQFNAAQALSIRWGKDIERMREHMKTQAEAMGVSDVSRQTPEP